MLVHKPAKIAVIVATLLLFIITAVFNALASQPQYSSGVYVSANSTTGNVSTLYYTGLTPASFTFWGWLAIYLWMTVWICYCVAAIFITWDGDYLYKSDVFGPCYFYILFCLTLILNIVWIVLFDQQHVAACLFVLFAMSVLSMACLLISVYAFRRGMQSIAECEFKPHYWLIQILVHNGIGSYAMWLTVASHIYLCIALKYHWNIGDHVTVVLIVLLGVGATFSSCEVMLIKRPTRYLLTPYFVLVLVAGAIVCEQVDFSDISNVGIFMVVVLTMFCFLLFAKIGEMLWRHFRGDRPSQTWMFW